MITNAKKTLDVYMYLSDPNDPQLNQVIDAAKRGVAVRFVANCGAMQPADLQRVTDAGIKVMYQPSPPTIHVITPRHDAWELPPTSRNTLEHHSHSGPPTTSHPPTPTRPPPLPPPPPPTRESHSSQGNF